MTRALLLGMLIALGSVEAHQPPPRLLHCYGTCAYVYDICVDLCYRTFYGTERTLARCELRCAQTKYSCVKGCDR